mmetsp:Transcript_14874/g.39781  ORF Transcript_14874/g.39781 Transcript_14874/m.39781 type:complete len:245 (-) Transcript_14874:7-741(-)
MLVAVREGVRALRTPARPHQKCLRGHKDRRGPAGLPGCVAGRIPCHARFFLLVAEATPLAFPALLAFGLAASRSSAPDAASKSTVTNDGSCAPPPFAGTGHGTKSSNLAFLSPNDHRWAAQPAASIGAGDACSFERSAGGGKLTGARSAARSFLTVALSGASEPHGTWLSHTLTRNVTRRAPGAAAAAAMSLGAPWSMRPSKLMCRPTRGKAASALWMGLHGDSSCINGEGHSSTSVGPPPSVR